jgi:hypothetical protein
MTRARKTLTLTCGEQRSRFVGAIPGPLVHVEMLAREEPSSLASPAPRQQQQQPSAHAMTTPPSEAATLRSISEALAPRGQPYRH